VEEVKGSGDDEDQSEDEAGEHGYYGTGVPGFRRACPTHCDIAAINGAHLQERERRNAGVSPLRHAKRLRGSGRDDASFDQEKNGQRTMSAGRLLVIPGRELISRQRGRRGGRARDRARRRYVPVG
jgi:hypothetical protein